MGETILGSLGFESDSGDHRALTANLAPFIGRRLHFTLRRNEYTVLIAFTASLTAAILREDIIEAGHLTVHEQSCQLVNDAGIRLFIPLGDVSGVEEAPPGSLRINLPGYSLHLTAAD